MEHICVLYAGDADEPTTLQTALEGGDGRITVQTAERGTEALEILAEYDVDCIVTAYDLPEQTGIALLESVRDEYPALPFILFPESGSEAVASRAVAADATDYLQQDESTQQHEQLLTRIRDAVSEYRQTRSEDKEQRQLRELTEVTNDVLYTFTADWGECLYVNSAYEDIFGRPIERLYEDSRDFLQGVHPDDRERVMDAMEQVSNGDSVDLEFRVNPDEGFERWVDVRGKPIFDDDGSVVRTAGFVRDITTRKQQERTLQRQNERLEHFTSALSHDLRNPLSVARTRLDLAQQEFDSEDLEAIADAHDRIEQLVEDVLTLAREGEQIESPDPVSLADISERSWQNVSTADATLDIETERTVLANRSRLQQLLSNLVRNAVEHGGEDVTFTVGDHDGGFYVADDGPGIPPAERDRIFEPGFSTEHDGSGFGLAIVHEIVQAHDWDIDVTESAEGGARFDITGVGGVCE